MVAEDNPMTETLNSIFSYDESSRYVACVGKNGGTYDINIMHGYMDSVEIIYQRIAIDPSAIIDILVYPLCFSVRHSIELALKLIIDRIKTIYSIRKKKYGSILTIEKEFKRNDHNISNLICKIDALTSIDKRLSEIFGNKFIGFNIFDFDPEGIAFRYADDLSGRKVLENSNVRNICIDKLVELYWKQMDELQEIVYTLECLIEEYKTGTFTKSLSRKDIEDISKLLPLYSDWSETINPKKEDIKSLYAIGSKELSETIDIIKLHPLFAHNIGRSVKLGNISDTEIETFATFLKWDEDHQPEEAIMSGSDLEMICGYEYSKERRKKLEGISNRALVTLLAFMQIETFCEEYEMLFQHFESDNREYLISKVAHYYSWKKIKYGMELCGQSEYLKIFNEIMMHV